MKVAIVAESIYNFVSGAAIFTKRLIDQLSEVVDEVVVITAGDKKCVKVDGNKKIYFFPSLEIKQLKKFPVPIFRLKSIKNILKKEKVDVLHIQLPSPLCVAALYHAKKIDIPIVVTSHTQPDNILDNLHIKSDRLKRIFYHYISWLYKHADYIVCPSEHARKELLLHNFRKTEKMEVISNGIDTNYFVPKGKKKKLVLYVGRIMKEKCIPTLIKASAIVKKRHPDYAFAIAGDGFLLPELKKLAKKVNPEIMFTGRLSDDKLLSLYQSSSIFVLPSESELQGIVLLEAMSCGVPTIASDSKKSAARELANLLFRHNDEKDLASKINHLIEHPKEMQSIGLKNRETILKDHNYSKIIGKYLAVYERVINAKKLKGAKQQLSFRNKKRLLKKFNMNMLKGFISAKYLNRQYPLWIDLRVTNRCNLRCIYCNLPNNNIKEMTLEEIKDVLKKITAESWILLTGGEPLIRNDIKQIIDHVVFNTPHRIVLNSNLVLMKQKYDQVKNCDGFYFSLDGGKETHEKNKGKGTWKHLIEALELLHKEGRGKISMTVVTDNTNIEDVKEVLRLCKKYEIVPAFQLVRHYSNSNKSQQHAPSSDNAIKIFDYLIRQRKKGFVMMNSIKGLISQKKLAKGKLNLPCYSGKVFCTIDSDGVLGLCFSRPRNTKFLNLKDKSVSFKKALHALLSVKNSCVRCPGCSCMAPIEFALANLLNFDVLYHNNESFSRFIELENKYIQKK